MTDEMGRREFLRRGTVAGVIATTGFPLAGALPVPGAHPAVTAGPVAHADGAALAGRYLDSKDFCLTEYDALQPALSFSATNAASAAEWQQRARRKLVDRLG